MKEYGIVTDQDNVKEYDENTNYREYKKHIRNLHLSFEQKFSELKDRIQFFENNTQRKNENEIHFFISSTKKNIEEMEMIHKNGLEILDMMKQHFSYSDTYSLEIIRYFSIFDKFKIQLQNMKNTFDRICANYSSYGGINKRENLNKKGLNQQSNDMNHVIKEREALENSINELNHMISQGESTHLKLKKQNYNILEHIKKMEQLQSYLPQINKVLKKIKYYNLKKTLILTFVIAICIFIFFIFR